MKKEEKRILVLFYVAVSIFILTFQVWAESSSPNSITVVEEKGVIVTWAEIVQYNKMLEEAGVKYVSEPPPLMPVPSNLPIPQEALVRAKNQANIESQTQKPGQAPQPLAPSMNASFEALPDDGTIIPPDTNGAVGPNHLMIPLNSQVRIQNKTGGNISTVSLLAFWQVGFPSVSDIFDPKVIYDPNSSRFFFVTCAERRVAASSMLFATSASNDPTGTWYMWQLDGDTTDTYWVDYPNIGVNVNWVTFTSNMFRNIDDAWGGVNTWAVDKSTAITGGALTSTLWPLNASVGGVHVPCLTFSNAETTQYIINVWNSSFSGLGWLKLYTITGTAGSPTWTMSSNFITSTEWSGSFPDAPQFGSAWLIETNEDRMMNAVLRNGSLWCIHAIALPTTSPTHTAVKWWEINPVAETVTQVGIVDDYGSSSIFYYFPSISVNQHDEVLIGFTGSSSTTYAGGYYTYRDSSTPANTMQSVSLLKAGEAWYYKDFGTGSNRWGDYSATCVDPTDDATLWTIQEYAKTPSSTWGTWWGRLDSLPAVYDWHLY